MSVNFTKIAEGAAAVGTFIAGNDDIKSFLCGTYADGTPRSVPDMINGEYLSPKEKSKSNKKKKKKGRKKKKNVKFKL